MTYYRVCELIGYLYDSMPDQVECETEDEKEMLRRIEAALFIAHEIQREKRP